MKAVLQAQLLEIQRQIAAMRRRYAAPLRRRAPRARHGSARMVRGMSTARRTFTQHAVDWALSTLACIVLLMLMAWMDSKQSETAALRSSTAGSNDRTAERAATKGTR
ncbi:hypothetical protein [Variovorax sp. RCC_210]|uniref:hypothetical protein n=1 Tax=Variovorax sp. RCC_210 TaxID=3239217 RepID=UPI003526479B